MAFWKQKRGRNAPTHWPVQRPVALFGTSLCAQHGCSREDAVQCAYVDRRGRNCLTNWCPDHQRIVDGLCYCRRHASLPHALHQIEFVATQAFPDTTNRAPSLANHVSTMLEPRVMALLESLRGSRQEIKGVAVHVIHPATGGCRWTCGWHLYDHTGVIARIAIEVDEAGDPEVEIRVGGRLMTADVPPWIARHRRDLALVSLGEDAAERERFTAMLFAKLEPQVRADVDFSRQRLPHYALP